VPDPIHKEPVHEVFEIGPKPYLDADRLSFYSGRCNRNVCANRLPRQEFRVSLYERREKREKIAAVFKRASFTVPLFPLARRNNLRGIFLCNRFKSKNCLLQDLALIVRLPEWRSQRFERLATNEAESKMASVEINIEW